MRQIHAIKCGGRLTIQTSIDGFRLIAERTNRYAPGRETTYTYDDDGRLHQEVRGGDTTIFNYNTDGTLAGVDLPDPAFLDIIPIRFGIADTDADVLVNGETGTGKELVARAVHDQSLRVEMPFVAVNCGALPEGLLESELFGHVKGSFTHAVSDKKGLIETADTGTLFLDEIGDISPAIQTKLLRVLQEH